MLILKENELMLLFISLENPLWVRLLKPGKRIQEEINRILGVAHGTIPNWRKGRRIAPKTAEEIFQKTKEFIEEEVADKSGKQELNALVDRFQHIYFDQANLPLDEAAQVLSMSIKRCQLIVDQAIYARLPVFPGMYYEASERGAAAAAEDYNVYRGLYHIWLRRDAVWLQCPMRVRYVLQIHAGLTLRCHMHLPMIDPEDHETYWEYDGFLVVREHKTFWMFEQRGLPRNDYIHFVASDGRSFNKRLTLAGKYLTTGQDPKRSIVAGDVLLQRQATDDIDKMGGRTLMDAAVLRDDDSHKIEKLWNEFSAA